jgi:hypothetical protein
MRHPTHSKTVLTRSRIECGHDARKKLAKSVKKYGMLNTEVVLEKLLS